MALKNNGVEVVMLTEDNKKTAATVANDLSIDRVVANVMPYEKVIIFKSNIYFVCFDIIFHKPFF